MQGRFERRFGDGLMQGFASQSSCRALLIGACALAVLIGGPAAAQPREDGAPAEMLGAGDTARANAWGPGALYFNPAGLLRVPAVLFSAGYSYLEGQEGHGLTASAVDAKTNDMVSIGAAYTFITGTPAGVGDRDGHQIRVGMGTGYRTGEVALYAGVGVRYLDLTIGEDDSDEGIDETNDVDDWTLDFGLILDFGGVVKLGVVGQNLLEVKSPEAMRELGVGLSFVFGEIDVSANLDIDLTGETDTFKSYGFGIDYVVAEAFHLRAGIVIDQVTGQERVTSGIGYSNETLALDLGYASAVDDPTDMVFALSLRFAPELQ